MFIKSVAALMFCFAFAQASADCGPTDGGGTPRERTIQLVTGETKSSFYYRAGHYAILVDPATLIATLQATYKRYGTPSDGRLLKELRAASRDRKYIDLFAIVLQDPAYVLRVEYLLSNVMEAGQARVVDAYALPQEGDRFLRSVAMVSIDRGAYSARRFCTPSGELLLETTDNVA
jgi:hypothetical protein